MNRTDHLSALARAAAFCGVLSCVATGAFADPLMPSGGDIAAAVTEPAIIAERATFWLDAADRQTMLTDESNAVTNWLSRDASGKSATVTIAGLTAPKYEESKYGQKCVDFGSAGSKMDLGYPSMEYKTAFFCVQIQQSVDAFLIGNSGNKIYMHRGNNGAWKYQSTNNFIEDAWQDGFKVTGDLYTTLMPEGFRVFAIRASQTCKTDSLTQDRNMASRNGGRQLSEMILFNEDLTDEQMNEISQYLLKKWLPCPPGVPELVARKAIFWLDASDPSTMLTNEAGQVTNWLSRTTGRKTASISADGYSAPKFEATKYGQACVDFGAAGSKMDLRYPMFWFQTAFLCVKIEQSLDAFLTGYTKNANNHRGTNGAWKYASGSSKLQDAWQDGAAVSGLTSTLIPDDDFYVLAIRMSGSCETDSLTQDRAIAGRNGGRQLSEIVFFDGALSDSEVSLVSQYLLRKWKLSPQVTVTGLPTERGHVSPDYGTYTDLEDGKTYTFKASAACTNDSGTFASECTGWSLVKADFSTESGSGLEKSFRYDDATRFAALSWTWSDWARQPSERSAWLPGGYRCVEYIEQGGDAWIDTEIRLSAKTTDIAFTVGASEDADYTGDRIWLGNNCADKSAGFALCRIKDDWRIRDSNYSLFEQVGIYSSARKPLTVLLMDGKWYFMDPDSADAYKSFSAATCEGKPASSKNLYLFTDDPTVYNYSDHKSPVGMRIYGLEIYEGAVCAHKLVACVRRRDNRPGFYDVVERKFLTNTVGALVAGPTDYRFVRGFSIIVR